jgi:poly-gamma-glutamate capsule biosynthesis protein CapA/YwtB (metallophosphatase superfamily)
MAAPEITLLFTGDIYASQSLIHVAQEIRDIASDSDLVVVNLESPLTNSQSPLPGKTLNLKSKPENILVLKELSTDVACIANNHICDFGLEGLIDTKNILAQNKIYTVGAGKNSEEAYQPLILEKNGITVGFLAYGDEFIEAKPSGPDEFGCAIINTERISRAVHELKEKTDIVVVQLHWGYTNYHYPLPEHVQLGRMLINSGAKLVVGHHPHVIQGYEICEEGAIVYSLGNFVFGAYKRRGRIVRLSGENYRSMLCRIKVKSGAIASLDFIHTIQADPNGYSELITGGQKVKRQKLLAKLSSPIKKDNYAVFFKKYTARRLFYRAIRWLHPRQWSNLNTDYFKGIKVALRSIFK